MMVPTLLTGRDFKLEGSAIARALLRLAGWRVQFEGLPAPQGVAVVYPHTSNWDFVVGVLAKWSIGFPAAFWGKDTLFRVPLLGAWLRWLGGIPVVRDRPQGVVGQTVQQLLAARASGRLCWLALAPEGTRGYRAGWRSGFHRVACGAGVPVGVVRLDYGRRCVGLTQFWQLSGDAQADLEAIASSLAGCRGRHPQLAAPVRLLEP